MSIDDTDECASKRINATCNETEAFKNILKCTNTGEREVNANSKLSEIICQEDLIEYVSANDNDYQTDSPKEFDEKWAESELKSIFSCKISDEFTKNDIIPIIIRGQGIFTNAENIPSEFNLKTNAQLNEVIKISEVATDPVENKIKNYDISEYESRKKSSEEEAMLIDLHEALIQDTEVANENMEGSSRSFPESSNEELGNLDFLSFTDPQNGNKDQKNDYSVILHNVVAKNFIEELHLCSDDEVLSQPFIDKNCGFDPMQDIDELKSVSSELINKSTQEYLNRIDEKIERIGLRKSSIEITRNISSNMKRSNSISDLYCEWFKENYIKEEIEYRWGSDEGFIGEEYLAMNRPKNAIYNKFKSCSFGQNLNENENKVLTRDDDKSKNGLNDNALDEGFVGRQKCTNNMSTKEKFEVILEHSAENLNEIFTVKYFEWVDDVVDAENIKINRCSDITSIRNINKCNKGVPVEKYPDRSILNCKNNEEKDEFSKVVVEMSGEEFKIRNRIENFMMATFSDMCLAWKAIFVRSFGNVLADTAEFLTFVFYLSVCLLYLFYENVHFIISNCKFPKTGKSSNNICDKKEKCMILETARPMSPITASKVIAYETTSSKKENTTDSSSIKKKEIIKLKDPNLLVKIEPIEVAYTDYELVTEMAKNVNEKNEKNFPFSCIVEQQMPTVKTNEDCKIYFKLIDINENEENESLLNKFNFDVKTLASKRYGWDRDETEVQKEDNSYNFREISEKYEEDSELDLGIKIDRQRYLPGILCRDEQSLLNSTEVEMFEKGAIPKYKSCSDFEVLSASDINYSGNDSFKTLRRISVDGKYLNSSSKVNLSPFSSKSDISTDSVSFLIKSEGFHDGENIESAEDIKILDGIKVEPLCALLLSCNPDMPITEKLQKSNLRRGNEANQRGNYFEEKSTKSGLDSQSSEVFQSLSAADDEF